MSDGKNRITGMVNDKAKANLVAYQAKHKIHTRDEAIEAILELVPIWEGQQEVLASLQARIGKMQDNCPDGSASCIKD